ncbi:hypothetical protein ACFQY7_41225 [Actinomadura luteofluorescens]
MGADLARGRYRVCAPGGANDGATYTLRLWSAWAAHRGPGRTASA